MNRYLYLLMIVATLSPIYAQVGTIKVSKKENVPVVDSTSKEVKPLKGGAAKAIGFKYLNSRHYRCTKYYWQCLLVPEIQYGNNAAMLGITIGFLDAKRYSGYGSTLFAGKMAEKNINIIGFSIWNSIYAKKVNFNLGLRGMNYWSKTTGVLTFRPQIGLGYKRLLLSYGYELFQDNSELGLTPHNIALSYYLPIFSF